MVGEQVLRGRLVSATMDITDGVLMVDGGRITYAGPASEFPGAPEPTGEVPQRIILPGLVDLHCHGAHGSDFSEGSLDGAWLPARTWKARSSPPHSAVRMIRRSCSSRTQRWWQICSKPPGPPWCP